VRDERRPGLAACAAGTALGRASSTRQWRWPAAESMAAMVPWSSSGKAQWASARGWSSGESSAVGARPSSQMPTLDARGAISFCERCQLLSLHREPLGYNVTQ
jgi:hypothetical protein